ncbi:hypothetical protein [Luteimicrobium subarcticum]|uniref:Lipoprotein LprG n=1 Tax=Luteimicrobium subarcticum TaxID=620910 RepID=A0A2M8W3N6_9MICO|nr:hypothetical protein [Luteimicrobium subarcticum]PJI85541.1 hypothetical protein CLV34_2722 [Luteimicrobium subarcticum]
MTRHPRTLPARATIALAGAALTLTLTLTACSGTDTTPTGDPAGTTAGTAHAATPTATTPPDPQAFTTALADTVARQTSVRVTGPMVQRGQDLTVRADLTGLGDPDLVAAVTPAGTEASHVVVKDGTFYLDIGSHVNHRYLIVKPGKASSPLGEGYGGFVDQIDPATLTAALADSATDLAPSATPTTLGGRPVTAWTLTVTRAGMKKILTAQVGAASLPMLPTTFDVDVLVGDDGLPARIRWDVKGARNVFTYSRWGAKVSVEVPAGALDEHVLYP